jgi:hypothetical protein
MLTISNQFGARAKGPRALVMHAYFPTNLKEKLHLK